MRKNKNSGTVEIRVDIRKEFKNAQGIHLIDPDKKDIDSAIDTAERDLFDVIWVHYSNVICIASRQQVKQVG